MPNLVAANTTNCDNTIEHNITLQLQALTITYPKPPRGEHDPHVGIASCESREDLHNLVEIMFWRCLWALNHSKVVDLLAKGTFGAHQSIVVGSLLHDIEAKLSSCFTDEGTPTPEVHVKLF